MQASLQGLALVLAQPPVEPDPEIVTPGLIGLAMVLVLGVAVYFLYRSMKRQLKRVDFEESTGPVEGDDEQAVGQQ